MSQFGSIVVVLLLTATSFAEPPTFEEFRNSDRECRITGKTETPERIALLRVDRELLARVSAENAGDAEVLLGAAELGGDWGVALRANGTNAVVALRFACVLAEKRDFDRAAEWLRLCRSADAHNVVPWLGELWLASQKGKVPAGWQAPESLTKFESYDAVAARARVRCLEKTGYSAYAARRVGVMREQIVPGMAQYFARTGIPDGAEQFLRRTAQAMQRRPTFILTELCGQSLEVAVPGADEEHVAEMNDRRKQLQEMLAFVEHNVVETATEEQMTRYYDDVLTYGEEDAMRRLARAVRP